MNYISNRRKRLKINVNDRYYLKPKLFDVVGGTIQGRFKNIKPPGLIYQYPFNSLPFIIIGSYTFFSTIASFKTGSISTFAFHHSH